ncbi:uncharacterized protein LOC111245449 isoform X2 [Varroa destructor]|nr:uncharacterized protein LOC111245449 isoform X2 [Varroa destructor]
MDPGRISQESAHEHGEIEDTDENEHEDVAHEVSAEGEQTLYVQTVEAGEELAEHAGDANTQIIHIIQGYDDDPDDEVEVEDSEATAYLEEDEDFDEEDESIRGETHLVNGKLLHYMPIGRTRQSTHISPYEATVSNASKKHSCGEEKCSSAYRSKKALVQHLNLAHALKLVTFERSYASVAHILYEFERIQRYANYLFGADYKTFNSSTKQLRVIYVCAHDRKLRKNRQIGQVCTTFIEFAADYNTGQGRLSGCLQHYKHGGYRDLSDYQFVHADEVPADFELVCPICCETFATEEEMLQHAFEKIHHIAPRFIRMAKKKEAKDAGWDSEMTNTLIRCDMCSFETADRSYFMTHRVKSHMGPECVEKHVAKNRDDANYIFRQAQIALNTRFFLANKRVNDSSIVSYSFRCNYNRRSPTSVCVCSFKMLEFPDANRYEIEMVKVHSHDVSTSCEEELDDLPPPPELFSCQTCDRVFQNEAILRDHQKANNHYNVVELEAKKSREVVKQKQFFCCVCSVGFTKKLSLRQHQKNFNHNYTPANVRAPISSHAHVAQEQSNMPKEATAEGSSTVREKKVIQLFPHLCYDCGQTLSNKVELLKHLHLEHKYDVDLFSKEFANMDLVWRYFYEIQLNTKTRYKQHGSQKVDEDNFKIYYICNREGKDKTKKVNRKRGRRKPPKDVNRACTAHFTIRRDNGKIICSGSTTHYGHDIEEEFLLRGKILQKAMEIIQKVPDEAAEDMHVLTAADFPYHSEKREMHKSYKNPEAILWSQPFSDTFTVTPSDDNSFYVGPTDKPARLVSHKTSVDSFCTICAGKPTRMNTGQLYQCPHIYQCDCEFYQAGYHNCKHINVLELYLNQESTQGNVLYLTAPCSEKDLAIRAQASKLAQLSEDVVKILENLNASEDSTKLLTCKMDAIKSLLGSPDICDAETQTDELYQVTAMPPVIMRSVVQQHDDRVAVVQAVASEENRPPVACMPGTPLVIHPIERTRTPAPRKAIIVNSSQSPRLVVRKDAPTSMAAASKATGTSVGIRNPTTATVATPPTRTAETTTVGVGVSHVQDRREIVLQSPGRRVPGSSTMVPVMALMQLGETDSNGTAVMSVEQLEGEVANDETELLEQVGTSHQQEIDEENQLRGSELPGEPVDAEVVERTVRVAAEPAIKGAMIEKRHTKVAVSVEKSPSSTTNESPQRTADSKEALISPSVEPLERPLRKRKTVEETDLTDPKRTSHRAKKPNRKFDL